MCKCTPGIRTLFCGKGDCVPLKEQSYNEAILIILGNISDQELNMCNEISNNYPITGDEALILIKTVEEKHLSQCISRMSETRDIPKVLHEYFTELYNVK